MDIEPEDPFTAQLFRISEKPGAEQWAAHRADDKVMLSDAGHTITLDRDAADRLAVWLRCRLDGTPAPKRQPEPPADTTPRRAGYWTLKSHAISMPPGLHTPDAVRSELYALGIRFLEAHVTRDCITFKGCAMVPERLPGWLTAEQREDRADG